MSSCRDETRHVRDFRQCRDPSRQGCEQRRTGFRFAMFRKFPLKPLAGRSGYSRVGRGGEAAGAGTSSCETGTEGCRKGESR